VLIPPRFLLDAFVVLVMVSIGLRVQRAELFTLLRNHGLLARSLIANCVAVPIIGFLLTQIIPMDTSGRIGFLLLAALPGTPAALQFTRTARDRLAFVATLAFILSMAAVVIAPVAVQVVPHAQSQYQPGEALLLGLLLQLVAPLAVGAVIARIWPPVVAPLSRWLDIVATLTFLLLMWETRAIRREAFRTLGSGLVVALFALLFASMAVGWFLGGPDRETRRVMATSTSMRNIVVTFFIARYWFPGTPVYLVPIAYLGIMVPANMLFTLYRKIRHKREVTISAVSP
jgi:bile acid:Na+ symporter, BASS family